MPTYVLLMKWRDAGGMPTSDELEKAFGKGSGDGEGSNMFEQRKETMVSALTGVKGGELKTLLWTLGETDMVAIVEAKSNEEIGGLSMFLGDEYGVRTQTLPAFEPQSMSLIGQVAARCGSAVKAASGGGPGG
jgi:uncharacterized protein with GYD domain